MKILNFQSKQQNFTWHCRLAGLENDGNVGQMMRAIFHEIMHNAIERITHKCLSLDGFEHTFLFQ